MNETTQRLFALFIGSLIGIGSAIYFCVWIGGFLYDIAKTTSKRCRSRRGGVID